MARKRFAKHFGKIVAVVILLVVTILGVGYGSLLRAMDQAAEEYSRGDMDAALKHYESIEQRLQSFGAMRLIPTKDRRTLILNQAQLFYALGRYDEAEAAMDREAETSGTTANDAKFLLLKGQIVFRRAAKKHRQSANLRLLEDGLRTAEDYLRESLRLSPNDWDAKYNFEFMTYIRKQLNPPAQGELRLLMNNEQNADRPTTALPVEQSP
jgi:tetratricopeptide (TPR) repeat protein